MRDNRKDKILLINPPAQRLTGVYNAFYPLGLGYLATFLAKHGFEAMVYNADKGVEEKTFEKFDNVNRISAHENYIRSLNDKEHFVWSEIRSAIKDFSPSIIGIGCMTNSYQSALKIARIARDVVPEAKIVFGGPHPSILPQDVIKNETVDFVISGEGEYSFLKLAEELEKGAGSFDRIPGLFYKSEDGSVKEGPPPEYIKDLDFIPIPDRKMNLNHELYTRDELSKIMGSRGCPFRCTFCSSQGIWGRGVRMRGVDDILEEIKYLVNTFGTDYITFFDDTFGASRKHLMDLCSALIETGMNKKITWSCTTRVNVIDDNVAALMYEAGCRRIGLGVESGSPKILKEIKKDIAIPELFKKAKIIKRHRITLHCYFMIGFPQETESDVRETMDVMRSMEPDSVNICIFTPYPGSELYDVVKREGLLEDNPDWSLYSHHSPYNYFSPLISRERFAELVEEMTALSEKINKSVFSALKRGFRDRNVYLKNPKKLVKAIGNRIIR